MKAMILAAGLGTRLRPLTEKVSKALIPVVNIPVLTRNIEYLRSFGINEIIINSHYLSRQILDLLKSGVFNKTELKVKVEPEILGTGGGIANCRDFLDEETFVVINSDIITDINLSEVFEKHEKSKKIVTMVLHDMEPFNQILVDHTGKIVKIHKKSGGNLLAFTGIHVMEPEIFAHIPDSGYSDIIHEYRSLIASGIQINSFLATGHIWHDIGTIDSYMKANKELLEIEQQKISIGTDSSIDSSVEFKKWAVIGNNTVLEKNTVIDSSIIWDNVIIGEGVTVKDSVITSGKRVTRDLMGEIY
jgi:mannose-1-phosphate guanylyltransferase